MQKIARIFSRLTPLVLLALLLGFLPQVIISPAPAYAATLDIRVANTSDDCDVFWNGSAWGINTTEKMILGDVNTGALKQGGGMRFLNVALPQGANITTAYLTFRASASASNNIVKSNLTGEAIDNASTFSTLANYQARRGTAAGGASNANLTSAYVNWDSIGAWTSGSDYNSPEIKTIIQEIVNRAGWASGNAMVIFFDDHLARGTQSSGVYRYATSYDVNSSFAPLLHIEYVANNVPTVSSSAATSVNYTTATLNGNITVTGGENATVRGFWYDTDSGSPYAGNTSESGSYGTGAYSLAVSNLTAGTAYYFKAWAQNSVGIGNSTELSFTTLSQTPAVTSDNPTYVSPGDATATLNGNLTSLGDASSSNVSFQWGYTVSYGTNTSPLSRNTTGTYGQNLTGFVRGTTVHYRAMAANAYGTVFGSDKSFSIAANTSAEVGWFQPNAIIAGTTLPDRDTADGAQNGVITWGANPAGVGVTIGGTEPIATPTATPTTGPTAYPTTNVPIPSMPGGMFDPGTPTFPGADVPGEFEAGAGVSIFWFVFPLMLILLLGIFIHDKTKSLFAQATVMGLAICFVSFFHIWPLWMIAPFAMMSGACVLAGKVYSY